MNVGNYLERAQQLVIACRPEDTVQSAATLLSAKRIGAMPVRNAEGRLVGILSERDIVRAFAQVSCDMNQMLVGDLMSRNVITCTPETTMAEASQLMSKHRFRHLPVLEDATLVGIISIRDALEVQLQGKELEANVLRDISIASRVR